MGDNRVTKHLFVVLREDALDRVLVDHLHDADDVSVGASDRHAEEGVGGVPDHPVEVVLVSRVLHRQSRWSLYRRFYIDSQGGPCIEGPTQTVKVVLVSKVLHRQTRWSLYRRSYTDSQGGPCIEGST